MKVSLVTIGGSSVLWVLCLLPSLAQASAFGPSSGGGGFAVVCPETPVSQQSVELLDLYEGRYHLNLKMMESSGDLAQDYINSADRTYTLQGYPDLAEEISDDILENLKRFFYITNFVEGPGQLPEARDLGHVGSVPRGCEIVQLAYFDDAAEVVYVRKDLWQQMDTMSQAALVQHELWFRQHRKFQHQTSKFARATVAHIFSNEGVKPLWQGLTNSFLRYSGYPLDYLAPLPAEGGSRSTGELTEVYVAGPMHHPKGHTLLQFYSLLGRSLLTQTIAILPIEPWELEPSKDAYTGGHRTCSLVDNGQSEKVVVADLVGSMTAGLSIRVRLKPGEPVTLELIEDSTVLGTSFIGSLPKCEGVPYQGN